MFVNGSGQNDYLYREPSMDASTKFRFIWQSGFRAEDF